MSLNGKTVFVTGANRGIGRALVDEAVRRGASRVYSGTRQPLRHPDARVVPVVLDVTNSDHIRAAAAKVDSLDVLVNNAGIGDVDSVIDRSALERHLAVHLYGTYDVTHGLLPQLIRSRGTIVNNVSLMALAPFPLMPAYAVSKAAALNLTQALRALLARHGVTVHAVLTGPTDTDMTRVLDIPKASPASVAAAIFDAVAAGEEDIFPDPMSALFADAWRTGPAKELERQSSGFAPGSAA